MKGNTCDAWGLKDPRVQAVHLPANIGLGNARNTGMKYAKGDYVFFVDSDDWLEADACERMLFKLQEYDCDVCTCGYQCVREDGQITGAAKLDKEFYLGRELLEGMLSGSIPFSCAVWKFMFKRERICDLPFDRDIY